MAASSSAASSRPQGRRGAGDIAAREQGGARRGLGYDFDLERLDPEQPAAAQRGEPPSGAADVWPATRGPDSFERLVGVGAAPTGS